MQSIFVILTPISKDLVTLILHNIIVQTSTKMQSALLLVMW